jgi:LacI family transcriptional regulator
VPHVFVNRGIRRSGRNIVMDDARSVELALDHLVELGHRSIVHVAGPLALDPVERRVAAFRSGAVARGLARAEVVEGDFLEHGGADGARLALERWPDITAVFTGSVSQALGVLNLAWKLGFTVPDDLSVVAHADTSLAAYSVPPLTAVQMPLAELGAGAVNALVEQIEMGAARDVLVGAVPKLALRASTAPPRSARTLIRSD